MENLNSKMFNIEFGPWGGLLDRAEIATYPDPMKSSFELVREYSNLLIKKRFPNKYGHIYFDFINSNGLNAMIMEYSPRSYLLGLFGESVMLLESAFQTIMSHPDIFSEIGDPSRGKIESYGSMKLGWPNDVVRGEHADHFFIQALSFLIYHELGHIGHGHLDYVSKKDGKSLYAESGYTHERCFDSTLSQALELQADTSGIEGSILFDTKLLAENREKLLPITLNDSKEWIFHMWAFSISILFFLFEHLNPPPLKQEDRTHPHPRLRQHLIEGIYSMRAKDDEEIKKGIASGFATASTAAKTIGWKETHCNVKEEFVKSREIFELLAKGRVV